jgi:tRNA A-37 threonylcarbamoyl transferase component Bud32
MASEFLARNEEIVDGTYRLGALIRRTVRSVVYETEFGEHALPAVIKIRETEGAEAETLIARLRQASELAHPNLLKIYAAGASVLNDVPIVYAVMERADLSLQEVVSERALTESETREMLVPTLEALRYLHKEGYAHSRLSASNVLASKDQLKLSSDSAIRAGNMADDMRELGALIVLALTQQASNADLQEPFGDIARHCLDPDPGRRWTVEQVQARLAGPAPAVVPPILSVPVESVPPAEETNTGIPKWIYAGLAALVLVVLLAAVLRRKDAPVVTTPVVTAPVTTALPAVAEQAPRVEVAPPVSHQRGRKADGWSVIVGAYGAREPAEKRVRAMMSRWPHFKISVSEGQGEKTRYLVVLGQNLSEDQAEALRKRAVDSGLPRDTYIKRVM